MIMMVMVMVIWLYGYSVSVVERLLAFKYFFASNTMYKCPIENCNFKESSPTPETRQILKQAKAFENIFPTSFLVAS